jgi:hypothetical protein
VGVVAGVEGGGGGDWGEDYGLCVALGDLCSLNQYG